MPQPILTRELQASLRKAFDEAARLRHEYVTLEHLLLALLEDPKAREAIEQCGGDIEKIRRGLLVFFENHLTSLRIDTEEEPQSTVPVERVLQRAAIHAISSEMKYIDGASVLIQLFKEEDTQAVYLLEREGLDVLSLKHFVSHGETPFRAEESSAEDDVEEEEEAPRKQDPLEAFATELVEEAEQGRIDPLVGRQEELHRTVQVLCRRRKNNPVFVGEPGVGKTALAEGLALRIHRGEVPSVLEGARVFSLDMGVLLAGTKFRGQFEERLKAVVKRIQEIDNAILFIDEIHTIVGAGATTGSSMDASNILKPALASGKLRCIGSTTFVDFKHIERDRALSRRFQKIEIKEPTVEETVAILEGLRERYETHHAVTYEEGTFETAARLAHKHLLERFLPDKAIDVIDEAGSLDQLRSEPTGCVQIKDIQTVVSSIARIPLETVSSEERAQIRDLEPELKKVIFGQDDAVEKLVQSIMLSRAGLRASDKPIGSFLFAGPTGVGKTELAKQLARILGIKLVRFDMSEYGERHSVSRLIGAPPGYVGFDQGGLLTDAVRQSPHSVVVLDEIEKAHPELFNILLQVMDRATLTDNNGRASDFRNVVLLLTTNAGAFEAAQNTVGFSAALEGSEDHSRARQAIERTFTPEFRNRLDATLYFRGLSPSIIRKVAEKEVSILADQLREKGVHLELDEEAYIWLTKHGYDRKFGARPMTRLVETELKLPIAKALVFDQVSKGSNVKVRCTNNKLDLNFYNTKAFSTDQ